VAAVRFPFAAFVIVSIAFTGVALGRPLQRGAQAPTNMIAFASDRGGDSDIYLASTRTPSRATNLTRNPAEDAGPAWSPDGQQLAFASTRTGTWDIFVLTLRDGTVRQVTSSPAAEFDPAWSRDGQQIAYERSRLGSWEVFVVPAEGGRPTNVSRAGGLDLDPAWNADGEVVFSSDRSGNFDLYSVVPGAQPELLAETSEAEFHPAPSPTDPSLLAFDRRADSGNYDLFTLDLTTRQLTRLTAGDAEEADPGWAPDGRQLVFVVGDGSSYELYLRPGTGRPLNLTQTPQVDETEPAWRPIVQTGPDRGITERSTGAGTLEALVCPTEAGFAGTSGDDTLYGDDGDNTLCGEEGTDDLHGGSGKDHLAGGPGHDRLLGEGGDDKLYGGMNYAGSGADRLRGGADNDRLFSRGDGKKDCVWGGPGPSDRARMDLGLDNVGAPTWGTGPCGRMLGIEALD
jgi:dipeptidyl aminopeptidase/acylaminoacyl peptidase